MSNVIQLPVIANVQITTDQEGRFNLNALHRASGTPKSKAPNEWLRTQQAKDLILALETQTGDSRFEVVVTARGGNAPGTFAAEQIAVAYANWISPPFYLKVIQTFIDYRTGKLQQPAIPQTLPEALRLAAELAEANALLAPKAEALDRIATSDGARCITNAAKDLQVRPKALFAVLSSRRWIYKRPGGSGWIAYQDKIQAGYLEHKITTVSRSDGSEKVVEQVLVTPKGLTRLAGLVNRQEDQS